MSNGGIYSRREKSGQFWQDYGLVIVVSSLLLEHVGLTSVMGYHWSWLPDQATHGEPAAPFWSGDYWKWYAVESNLSIMAEPWGVLVGIVLASHLPIGNRERV